MTDVKEGSLSVEGIESIASIHQQCGLSVGVVESLPCGMNHSLSPSALPSTGNLRHPPGNRQDDLGYDSSGYLTHAYLSHTCPG